MTAASSIRPRRTPRRARTWAVAATVGVAVGALVVGPLAAVVALGLGGQAVLAAGRWPTVGDACRTLVTRVVPSLVGWMVIVVALDWTAGALLDRARGAPEAAPQGNDLLGEDLPAPEDPRVHSEAYVGQPWVERYFAELEHLDFSYVPYIGPREAPVQGRYINSADGIRRSYLPPAARDGGADVEVWFFGGSTLWGEGQRDLHTIPSEVARLADADGTLLRAVNFGERGYTAFQEFLLFEQELARRGPPDVAVFYHGLNEVYSLLEAPGNFGRQPSIFQIDTVAEAFGRAPPLPGQRPPPEPSIARKYADTSAVHRLLAQLAGLGLVEPAAAQSTYEPTEEQTAAATDHAESIYRRSVDLIEWQAERYDVPAAVFWQPHHPGNAAYVELTERVADLGFDISDAFDDLPGPIFIDGAHTNELGARIAAEAIWGELRAVVEQVDR